MKLRVGIVGLPNVGKSTLFNALAQKSIAQAENFPFCTIDPNVAQIPFPDPYLKDLGALAESDVMRPATMEWIDVAGLVRGAHRGQGLGNRFLGTLRQCTALCQVVRVFDDPNIIVADEGFVDPVSDAEVIQLELILADLQHAENRLERTTCQGIERETLEEIVQCLNRGNPARVLQFSEEQLLSIKSMGLLTLKPVLYTFNVDETDLVRPSSKLQNIIQQVVGKENDSYALVSAKLESELADLDEASRSEYQNELEIEHLSHSVLPTQIAELLGYRAVYTGPGVPAERSRTTKVHWIRQSGGGMTAHDLAGRLHGDIAKGFMRAQVISAQELIAHDSWGTAAKSGQLRTEGKDYELQPNDVVLVQWK